MNTYLLILGKELSLSSTLRLFKAENDREAEQFVEKECDEDDGAMSLYRLLHVSDWD